MRATLPATEPDGVPEAHCTVTLRVNRQTLATLHLMAIDIRFRTGASLSRSAILRSLIRWLEACDIDTTTIPTRDALRQSLLAAGAVRDEA